MAASTPISIITPAYNAERYVKRLAESVLSQRGVEFEWIIVEDCSTDGTFDALRAAVGEDSRVRLIRTPCNGGVADARNVGLAHATGDYICFLDADDSWAPGKLSVQHEFMSNCDADVTAMDYLRVG